MTRSPPLLRTLAPRPFFPRAELVFINGYSHQARCAFLSLSFLVSRIPPCFLFFFSRFFSTPPSLTRQLSASFSQVRKRVTFRHSLFFSRLFHAFLERLFPAPSAESLLAVCIICVHLLTPVRWSHMHLLISLHPFLFQASPFILAGISEPLRSHVSSLSCPLPPDCILFCLLSRRYFVFIFSIEETAPPPLDPPKPFIFYLFRFF